MKIDGSCHCGAIRYEAEVDPEKVYLCHCIDCQAISGSPFRWAASIAASDFTLLSGSPKTYVKQTADSGQENHQVFCPDCASPLYSHSPANGFSTRNLRLGTARQRAALTPKGEFWCGSAQSWVPPIAGAKRLDKQG